MELNKRFGEWTGKRDSWTSKNSTIYRPSRLDAHDFVIFIQPSMNDIHKSKKMEFWPFIVIFKSGQFEENRKTYRLMDETATTRKLSLSWVLIEICFALSSFGTPKSEACLKPSIIIKNTKKKINC